jgi:hypothetical protein
MTLSNFQDSTDVQASAVGAAGVILRDMGKQVTINDGALDTQVWRRVQIVSGASFEGVPAGRAPEDLYVITWSASGTPAVRVVRTG